MTGVDVSLRTQIRAKIQADYGQHTMLPGNKMPPPRRLPAGSLALGYVSGGGYAFRHMSRFWGAYCLAPETKILKADYSWTPVADLVPGDEIVGFDEFAKPGRGNQRTLQRAVVEDNHTKVLPSRRIVTDRGTDTVASDDHLWLVQNQSNGAVGWIKTRDMKVGDKILHFSQPWNGPVDREDAAYLGGLFDGEGWFAERARIFFAQNPGPVMEKGVALLEKLGFTAVVRNQAGPHGCRRVCATGTNAEVMRFLDQIPSIRMRANAGDWWVGRAISPKGPSRGLGDAHAKVLAIEDVGEREVCAIATSTKTLIADGLMSHNSSGKTLALYKAFIAAQNFGELRYAQLMALAAMSERAGEVRMVKVFKDQAKREREIGALACLFVNSENSIDVKHMERLGVDLSKIDIVTQSQIEGVGEIVYESLPAYHVIGVDSTTATMSIDEVVNAKNQKKSIFDESPATGMIRAGKWGINMDWWRSRLTPENIIIMTSHASEQVGARSMHGSTPERPPGGRKLWLEPGLVLHFMKSSALKRKANGALQELSSEDAKVGASAFSKFEPAGGVLVVKCDKNKVGISGRTVLLHHDKRTGDFDAPHEYEKFAAYFRVLDKSGTWWELPDGKKTQQLRLTLQPPDDAGAQEKMAALELRKRIEAVVLRCAEDAQYESSILAGRSAEVVGLPSAESV